MLKWYKVGAKFTEQQEDGTFKRVTKFYLIQGVSFQDAEMTAYEKLKHVMRGGGEIVSMQRMNVHKIIEGEADQFFELKIAFMQADESGKKEKKITHTILMRAHTTEEAAVNLRKSIKSDYPYFELTQLKMSDLKFAYPIDEANPTFDKAPNDEEEEIVDAGETETDDFEFPTGLDNMNKETLEELGATPEPAKATKAAKAKVEKKPVKEKKDAAFEMPK